MALDSYSGLKQSIADHLDRDDLASQIDDFIDLCEARNRQSILLPDGTMIPPVLIRGMLQRAQTSAAERFLSLPFGFLQMSTLRLVTDDEVTVLQEVNLDTINRQRRETTGKPKLYAVHNEIEFDITPSPAVMAEMIYYSAVTALSDANVTNAILTAAPNIYLYGALAASAPFLMNDERITVWNGAYVGARSGLAAADRLGRHSGPLVSRVSGTTP